MNTKRFWTGYETCIEDCQGVIKNRGRIHGDCLLHYFDCIDDEFKAALVPINIKYQRLRHKINNGCKDMSLIREDIRDLINQAAFLYSLVWDKDYQMS